MLTEPYASGRELRAAHVSLVRCGLGSGDVRQAVPEAKIRDLLARGQATGRIIEAAAEREAAQGILDYWVTELIGWGLKAPTAALDPFDPTDLPDLSDRASPYPGLSSMGPEDAGRLFGRDVAVATLIAVVRAQPLVVVHGPAGVGKASLVMAGLVPRLAGAQANGGTPFRVLDPVYPGDDPMAALAAVLAPGNRAAARRLLANPGQASVLMALMPPSLLIVPAFDEALAPWIDQAPQAAFARALAAAGAGHRVVLVVGDDALGTALALPGLGEATRFPLAPMNDAELRRAITSPADTAGLRFEEGVVDELVGLLAGDAAALPLLQFTLERLWEKRDRDRVALAAYLEVGNPRTSIERAAEAVFDTLDAAGQETARRLFLRLVRPQEGGGVRSQTIPAAPSTAQGATSISFRSEAQNATTSPAATDLATVADPWREAGLIRFPRGNLDRLAVLHPVLAQAWPRLGEWLREERDRSERSMQIETTARLWVTTRQTGYLLKGAALETAALIRERSPDIDALVVTSLKGQHAAALRSRLRWSAAVAMLSGLLIAIYLLYDGASRDRDLAVREQKLAHLAQAREKRVGDERVSQLATSVKQVQDDYVRKLDAVQAALNGDDRAQLEDALRALDLDIPPGRLQLAKPDGLGAPFPAPPLPEPVPPLLAGVPIPDCLGAVWLGVDGRTVTPHWSPTEGGWTGMTLTLAAPLRLRRGLPDANYRNQESLFVLPAGKQVTAVTEPKAYPRPGNEVQYWLPVRAAGRACATVYVQFTGAPPAAAQKLAEQIAGLGYTVPAQQELRTAKDLAQVRYYYPADQDAATQLAAATMALAKDDGVAHGRTVVPTSLLTARMTKPPPGTLELWIDLSNQDANP